MAIYRGLSRQFMGAANRAKRYETPKSVYHSFRNASSPEDLTPPAPQESAPMGEVPFSEIETPNVLEGGDPSATGTFDNFSYSPDAEQALVDSWAAPDIGGYAGKRAVSGLTNAITARAVGTPLSVSGKFGFQQAMNPASNLVAMANDFVPGLLARAPAKERLDSVLGAKFDDPDARKSAVGLFSDLENREDLSPEQREALVGKLHELGMDDYIDLARVRSATRQASRPFSTQIMDAIGDKMELGLKSLIGISQQEDLDRMISNDPAAAAVMRGHTYTKPMDEMAYSNAVKAPTAISPQGFDYGSGGGNGGGVGSAGGGRAASDAGMAGDDDAGGLGGFGMW